jgi:hypothetical protein
VSPITLSTDIEPFGQLLCRGTPPFQKNSTSFSSLSCEPDLELKPLNNPHLPKSIQNRVSSGFPSICFSYQSSLFQEDFSILWPFRPIFGSYFLYFYQVFSFFCKFGALLRLYAVARSRWY